MFLVMGVLEGVLLADVVRTLTGSAAWGVGAVAVWLADPATLIFRHQFFYPEILSAALLAVMWGGARCLGRGRRGGLWVLAVGVIVCVNTSSLYHPVWGIGVFAATIGARVLIQRRRGEGARSAASVPVAVILTAGALAWPAKNAWVFGQFTTSTWAGYNAARSTDLVQSVVNDDNVQRRADRETAEFVARHPAVRTAVVAVRAKSDGSMNWNQYRFVVLNEEFGARVWHWRTSHRAEWLRTTVAHYAMWTRPSYLDGYYEQPDGPDRPAYRGWQGSCSALLYGDLSTVVRRIASSLAQAATSYVTGRPVPWTVFGVLILPGILIGACAAHVRRFSCHGSVASAVCMLAVAIVLWVLVIPCLTDGHEGNRMRYAVSPLVVALGVDLALRMRNALGHAPADERPS